MAAQGYGNVCEVCGEKVAGNMQVHLMSKCQGYERRADEKPTSTAVVPSSSAKTVKVRFQFKPLSNLSFRTVTLLSSFTIDLTSNGVYYTSEYTDVPVGEYDGQLIIGTSFCYPLKKFMIDREGETVPLEIDFTRMDSEGTTGSSYSTDSYTTTTGTGSTTSGGDRNITIRYNPSYQTKRGGPCPNCGKPNCTSKAILDSYADSYGDAYTYSYGNGSHGDGGYGDGSYGDDTETGQRKVYAILYVKPEAYADEEDQYVPTTTSYLSSAPKAITQKQRVVSNSPPSSDSESTPTESAGEEFSRQLSAEGFGPAKVKSKGSTDNSSSSSSSAVRTSSHTKPVSSTKSSTSSSSTAVVQSNSKTTPVSRPAPPAKPAHQTSKTGSTTITQRQQLTPVSSSSTAPDTTGFPVADIKSPTTDVATLQEENRRLRTNLERVTAQWEGRVRRLEGRLKQYGEEPSAISSSEVATDDERVVELEETLEQLRTELEEKETELDQKERELVESKDRVTALENQMVEYATLMNDQSKLLNSSRQHDHDTAKIQELYYKAMEFTKKQQVEFQEKLSSLEADIVKVSESNKETTSLHAILETMKAEVEEYRIQTKSLVKEMENKDRLIQSLQDRLSEQKRSTSEFESLEFQTMKEKCDAWRDRAEELSKEMDELKIVLDQLSRDKLAAEENLAHQLEASSSEMSVKHTKLEESMRQVKELQSMRVKMETDLHALRSEKTQVLERNAELVESCDPEKHAKLKREVISLQQKLKEKDSEISKLRESLHFHTENNRELKEHLDAALNEETLQQIEQRITKYKKERDATKENMRQQVKSYEEKIHEIITQHDAAIATLREELEQKDEENLTWKVKAEEYRQKKVKYHENKKQLVQEVERLHAELQEREEYIASLVSREDVVDYHHQLQQEEEDSDNHSSQEELSSQYVTEPAFGSTQSLPLRGRKSKEAVPTSSDPVAPRYISAASLVHEKPAHSNGSMKRQSIDSRFTSVEEGSPKVRKSISRSSSSQNIRARTASGEKMFSVESARLGELSVGRRVAVKRKDGVFDCGLLRYLGTNDKGEDICGISLEVARTDPNGKNNDGTYKNGERYFHCKKGYGLYTGINNIFHITS